MHDVLISRGRVHRDTENTDAQLFVPGKRPEDREEYLGSCQPGSHAILPPFFLQLNLLILARKYIAPQTVSKKRGVRITETGKICAVSSRAQVRVLFRQDFWSFHKCL